MVCKRRESSIVHQYTKYVKNEGGGSGGNIMLNRGAVIPMLGVNYDSLVGFMREAFKGGGFGRVRLLEICIGFLSSDTEVLTNTEYWVFRYRVLTNTEYWVFEYGVLTNTEYWVFECGVLTNMEYWVFGYGVLAVNMFLLIVDQSITYDISADVDTTYSSKSGNGLEFFKFFRYCVFF
ncbi:hypothetical protein Tco_0538064 [Tanacetum coccineum]